MSSYLSSSHRRVVLRLQPWAAAVVSSRRQRPFGFQQQAQNATMSSWRGSHVSELTGKTPIDDRQAIVDVFNANQYPGSLILNPDAAGKGLNIQGANHVIHFNPEWNPALTNQATARAYRRGQELPVFVNHFFYSNTVEQDVIEKAQHKRDLAEAVDHGALE